ncbi:hypothetical protein WJX72_009571 [[Myrmecia] bisecta]|uniref:Uncharacterized protein n=1 Tax=[Myrmecia] bisecta TaxID=41462 RepID=A0AAW1R8F4_9CHLO
MRKLTTIGPNQLGVGGSIFTWNPRGHHLAVAGSKRKVNIYDRSGKLFDEIHIAAPEFSYDDRLSCVRQLQWDATGESLAVLPRGQGFAIIWTAATKEAARVDITFKAQEASYMAWSRNGQTLAIGTSKGNLLLYNHSQRRKVPIMGKHTRSIVSGAWNAGGLLALGGRDNQVTISKGADGDAVKSLVLKGEPAEVSFSDARDASSGKQGAGAATVSVNVGKRTILMQKVSAEPGAPADQPIELAFQEQYGDIEKHLWYGDGYIVLGFKTGVVLVVSTHKQEISEEVHSHKYLDGGFADMAYCAALNRVAVAGGRYVKMLELGAEIREVAGDAIELGPNQFICSLGWTQDGQLLTVATLDGQLYTYLASLPVVSGAWGTRVAHLTSLQELTVTDTLQRGMSVQVHIETEPAFVAVGPGHVAVGLNNQVWFYRTSASGREPAAEVHMQDYLSSVQQLQLNATYAAALSEGRMTVHLIELHLNAESAASHSFQLPKQGEPADITCMALNAHFLIYGTRKGHIVYYRCEEQAPVNEFRHSAGPIRQLFPQLNGTRVIFEDERRAVHLFNPVNNHLLPITHLTGMLQTAVWDAADPYTFVLSDGRALHTFIYSPVTISGASVSLVGSQPFPTGYLPVALVDGNVTCQTATGALDVVQLSTHKPLQEQEGGARAAERLATRFRAALALGRSKEAWDAALLLKSPELWQQLAAAALQKLDIELAIRVYRLLGDAGMVLSLQRLRNVEERNLLAGHILAIQGTDYDAAQDLFLASSVPVAALEMRRDLQQWAEALKLAQQLDPTQIGPIARQYAQSLELKGDYAGALSYYQQALQAAGPSPASAQDAALCQAGMARALLQSGDVQAGRQLALQAGSPQLCRDCAQILESMNQLQDAAELYVHGGLHERAAAIYIQTRALSLAGPLLAKISSPKLHLQYAKAKEAEGKYAEAADAFEAAGEIDAVIRLNLERLNNPHKASGMVRQSRSVEGAAAVAKYCLASKDYQGAVEFLLLAKQPEQAFELAQTHNEMDTYMRCITDGASTSSTPAELARVAKHYESRGQYERAGDLMEQAQHPEAAVKLYIKANGDALKKAIAVVAKALNPVLTALLADFLDGSAEGSRKDPALLFQLRMALGQFEEAGATAVDMASQEQERGNYKNAHEALFATYQDLSAQGKRIPMQLTRTLTLLHSYILVKTLVRIGDHEGAARMLIRVARNISKFPRHVVPILTSTVVECQRAGLKSTAFEYAAMLMRPEYKNDINPAYKRKIESMVRKRERAEEDEEAVCECPFCQALGPESELDCVHCQNIIPFCIATGKRMGADDWAQCPRCRFPARHSELVKVLAAEPKCPMCGQDVQPTDVARVADVQARLRQLVTPGAA